MHSSFIVFSVITAFQQAQTVSLTALKLIFFLFTTLQLTFAQCVPAIFDFLKQLKEDGTVKGGMEIDPDNLSADLKDGPLSALTVDANLPAEDRLCRSMSAPGMVAVAEGTKHGFSILCGAGAHGEFGGDMWLFSFTGQSEAAKKAVAVVTEGQEYCPPVAKGSGARHGVMHVLSWMMVMCAATLWW